MAAHSISIVAIRDCRIRLMRGGSGAPLVFLHGGGGIGIWLPSMARLARKFDVIAPEHPRLGGPGTPDPQLRKWRHWIKVPKLLIWGDHDRVFPQDYGLAYQRLISGAKVVVIPECRHLPHVEKGDVFAAELEAFIGAMRIAA